MTEARSLDDISGQIVDAAFQLHRGLGPGRLESVYEAILAKDLEKRGLSVQRQKARSFEYDGATFADALRLDLLVEAQIIVEVKSVEAIAPVHPKQLLTYLRICNLQVGMLINFGAPTLKEGLRRIVNHYTQASSASPYSPRLRVNPSSPRSSAHGREQAQTE